MKSETPVDPALVGAVWPGTHPGEDATLYGHATLDPAGAFEARSIQTFRLVYTVGRYGVDDTGGIRVVFRFVGDQGDLQMDRPSDYNYVSARSEEHTSELQSLMRISYAVFCLKKKTLQNNKTRSQY